MPEKKHLGTITILTTDRHNNTRDLQEILTTEGRIIMARLGVNIVPACIEHCTGLISLAVQGTAAQIDRLTVKINQLDGIKAEAVIIA